MADRSDENSVVYAFDGFRLDVAKRLVYGADGKPISLKTKAFDTLLFLIKNPGRVIERDEIMAAVWPDTVVEENNLTQHIASLRRLFGEKPDDHRYIATIPGRGYKFVAAVHGLNNGNETSTVAPQTDKSVLSSRKLFIVLAAVLVISLLTLGFFYRQYVMSSPADSSIKSIAVLPFKPITEQNRDMEFESGMTIDLISKLRGAEGLRVRPYSAVRRFDSPDQDAIEAGRALGVDAVLEGYIQMFSSNRVRISVTLFNVADARQIWTYPPFVDELTDIPSVQDSISEHIANSLRAKLSDYAKKRYTENFEAYRLYLKGRMYQLRLKPEDVKQALEYYQKAIALDPNYALAYTGIADCYRGFVLSGESSPGEMIGRAAEAAEKAAKIDPQLAEAQTGLGINYFWFNRDWVASEAAFKRALDLDPNSAHARHHYAHLLSILGRHNDAIAEAAKGRELDSYESYYLTVQGLVYHQAGNLNEAFARFDEATKRDSNIWLPHNFAAIAYTDLGRYEEAIAAAQKATELNPSQSISMAYEIVARSRLRQHDEAKKLMDGLLKRPAENYVPPYHIAIAYMGIDDRENATFWLEKSFSEQDIKIVFLKTDRIWDELRSEPRFIALIKKMKLND